MYISADCRIVSTFLLAESVLSSSGLSTAPQRPTRQAVSHNQGTKSSLIQPPPPPPSLLLVTAEEVFTLLCPGA